MHPSRPLRLPLLLTAVLAATLLSACQSGPRGQGATPTRSPIMTTTPISSRSCQPGAYCARVPGPTCDLGGATWANLDPSDSTLTCAQDGMHYTESAVTRALVAFVPPSGAIPNAFSASITIGLTGAARACVGLITLTSSAGAGYTYLICQNSTGAAAAIILTTGTAGTAGKALAEQVIALDPHSTYTILVATRGANRQLTMNGVQVASVTDATYTTTQFILLELLPVGSAPATAVFSDFSYMPLS